MKKLFN